MTKKVRVQMHCQTCNKTTTHEVRVIESEESCVCLVCEENQKAGETALLRYENRHKTDRYQQERAIEAERARTFSPGG